MKFVDDDDDDDNITECINKISSKTHYTLCLKKFPLLNPL